MFLKDVLYEPDKLTCSQLCDFIAQLVRAMHRHRRGHGFESRDHQGERMNPTYRPSN